MKEGIIGLLFTTLLILLGAYILWNRMIPKNFEEIRLDMELYEQYKVEAEVEADIVSFHVTYLGSEMKEFILSEEDCKMLLMLLENTDYYYVGSSKRENVVEGGIYLLSARDENDLWCYVFEVTDEGDVSTLNNKYNIKNNRAILEFLEKISQK